MYSHMKEDMNYFIPKFPVNGGSETDDSMYAQVPKDDINSTKIISNFKRKRKAEEKKEKEEDWLSTIKELTSDKEDESMLKSICQQMLDYKRQKIGNVITWQQHDEKANKKALLDDNVNVIMQARKVMLAKDTEGVRIVIDQLGWEDNSKVRPKYAVVIERIETCSLLEK